MKHKWLRRAAQNVDPSAAGSMNRELGNLFETLILKYCKGAKSTLVGVGKHSVDVEWRSWWIEIKSGGISKKQLDAIVSGAAKASKNVVYVLLSEPTPADAKRLADAGVNAIVLN